MCGIKHARNRDVDLLTGIPVSQNLFLFFFAVLTGKRHCASFHNLQRNMLLLLVLCSSSVAERTQWSLSLTGTYGDVL